MNYYQQLTSQFGPLVVSCVISTFMVILIVAYSSHYLQRKQMIVGVHEHSNDEEKKNL